MIPEVEAQDSMLPGGLSRVEPRQSLAAERRQGLESLAAPHAKGLSLSVEVLADRRFLEVIRVLLREVYDLVIKPAEDPDWLDRLFGSDDMHLLRKCPCPVWLMKPEGKSNYQCIVAPRGHRAKRYRPSPATCRQVS